MRKLKLIFSLLIVLIATGNFVNGASIDLSANSDPTALQTELNGLTESSVITLMRGVTYNLTSTNLAYSVVIQSASGTGDPATIFMADGKAMSISANVDSCKIYDVEWTGLYGSSYFFSINAAYNLNKLIIDNSYVHHVRGILRTRSTCIVSNMTIKNSIIDSIGSYGVLIADASTTNIENITFSNTTFTNTYQLMRFNTLIPTSVNISNCSMYNTPLGGNFVRTGQTITNPILVSNTIFGYTTSTLKNGTCTINCSNSYATSDCGLTGFDTAPTALTEASADIWPDPGYMDLTLPFASSLLTASSTGGIVGDPIWMPTVNFSGTDYEIGSGSSSTWTGAPPAC